jgi:hypothetical protein
MEKISWTDHMKTEEVLRKVNEERDISHTIKRRKVKWIAHIVLRNCF